MEHYLSPEAAHHFGLHEGIEHEFPHHHHPLHQYAYGQHHDDPFLYSDHADYYHGMVGDRHDTGKGAAEYDYFAGMFSKPKAAPKPTPKATVKPAATSKPKPTSLPPVKQPKAPEKIKSAKPDLKAKSKPSLPKMPGNELYGDAKLPDVPPMTPYVHDLPHSYWDKQYAQAEYAIEEMYPHIRHHLLNEDDDNLNEYLALYGASELFA